MHIKQRKHIWGSMTIDVSFPHCAVAVCGVAGLLSGHDIVPMRGSRMKTGLKAPLLAAPVPFLPMIPTVGVK